MVNSPRLDFMYGPSNKITQGKYNIRNFEENYITQIDYGFFRIDPSLTKNNIFYHSSENVFFGNSSSHFKIFDKLDNTITTDMYRFGGAYSNGFGFGDIDNNELYFIHKSGFIWNIIDIEPFNGTENEFELLNPLDNKTKFGNFYSTGFRFNAYDNFLFVGMEYDETIIYTDFKFFPWFGSYLIENVSQRWADLFLPEILEYFGELTPIVYHLYKTSISFILYSLRSEGMNWPFGEEKFIIRERNLLLRFSLIF